MREPPTSPTAWQRGSKRCRRCCASASTPGRRFRTSATAASRDDRSGLARAVERYCVGLVEAAAPHAAAVKPQVAFFEALGGYGLTALERVCATATELGVPVIADAKRGDIPSTAAAYAAAWLESRPGGRGRRWPTPSR